jgi:hypothetical protein
MMPTRMERASTTASGGVSSRHAEPHSIHGNHMNPSSSARGSRGGSPTSSSARGQLERPYSTSSVVGRMVGRRSPAPRRPGPGPGGGEGMDNGPGPNSMRRRPSLLSHDEKQELTDVYNEHQNYLANSAVNLKQLHAALTNRLETPVSQYTSSSIALLQKQIELASGLKQMLVQFRRNARSNTRINP